MTGQPKPYSERAMGDAQYEVGDAFKDDPAARYLEGEPLPEEASLSPVTEGEIRTTFYGDPAARYMRGEPVPSGETLGVRSEVDKIISDIDIFVNQIKAIEDREDEHRRRAIEYNTFYYSTNVRRELMRLNDGKKTADQIFAELSDRKLELEAKPEKTPGEESELELVTSSWKYLGHKLGLVKLRFEIE